MWSVRVCICGIRCNQTTSNQQELEPLVCVVYVNKHNITLAFIRAAKNMFLWVVFWVMHNLRRWLWLPCKTSMHVVRIGIKFLKWLKAIQSQRPHRQTGIHCFLCLSFDVGIVFSSPVIGHYIMFSLLFHLLRFICLRWLLIAFTHTHKLYKFIHGSITFMDKMKQHFLSLRINL